MALMISKQIPAANRYLEFLILINAFHRLNLSAAEMQVMDEFYWQSRGVMDTVSRKLVAQKLNITAFNLNNFIRKLRIKQVIISEEDKPDRIIDNLVIDLDIDKPLLTINLVMQS